MNNRSPSVAKSIREQSDIVITADGRVFVSFLWEDLGALTGTTRSAVPAVDVRPPSRRRNLAFPEFEYRQCKLCPKECGFDRTAARHRTCGDHHLRVASAGLSLGDEPEIRGERGSGAIMLSGCPLKCPSCHNPEMVADGTAVTIEGFITIAEQLHARGAHNIQILSPTVHLRALHVALKELKDSGFPLPIVLKSSGYESVAQLQKLDGLVDVYLPDFKFGRCSQWSRRAGARNYFEITARAIEEMFRQVGAARSNTDGTLERGVLVRHVRAPLPPEESREIEVFLARLPDGIRVAYSDHFVSFE